MKAHLAYLSYVLRHKWFVFLACLRFGLFWRGIFHDLSKFSPVEWFPYVHTFYTSDGKKQYQPSEAFDRAWNHHQKVNSHHWQYWLLTYDSQRAGGENQTIALAMSHIDRREMLADWMGAGKALGKPLVWEWYEANKENILLHPATREWVEIELEKLRQEYAIDVRGSAMGFISSSWWW